MLTKLKRLKISETFKGATCQAYHSPLASGTTTRHLGSHGHLLLSLHISKFLAQFQGFFRNCGQLPAPSGFFKRKISQILKAQNVSKSMLITLWQHLSWLFLFLQLSSTSTGRARQSHPANRWPCPEDSDPGQRGYRCMFLRRRMHDLMIWRLEVPALL